MPAIPITTIIAGHEPRDSTSTNTIHKKVSDRLDPDRKMKIAVIQNYIDEASSDIQKGMKEGIKALQSAGHKIVYKEFMNSKYDIATYYIIATCRGECKS